jgi:hypothetical protein
MTSSIFIRFRKRATSYTFQSLLLNRRIRIYCVSLVRYRRSNSLICFKLINIILGSGMSRSLSLCTETGHCAAEFLHLPNQLLHSALLGVNQHEFVVVQNLEMLAVIALFKFFQDVLEVLCWGLSQLVQFVKLLLPCVELYRLLLEFGR